MITLDFTTTAVARPKIVNRTYQSFSKNLKGVDFKKSRLFINIDPLPTTVDRQEVVAVAEQYFGEVVANMPDVGNYTAAYNWVWPNAETEHIFNLEDDWLLTEEIDVQKMLKWFRKKENLYEVALRAYPYHYDKTPTSPSIMHERFYKAIGGNLDESLNPEVQLRGNPFGLDQIDASKVVAMPKHVVLQDIGRDWIESQPFQRPPKKARFTTWVEK